MQRSHLSLCLSVGLAWVCAACGGQAGEDILPSESTATQTEALLIATSEAELTQAGSVADGSALAADALQARIGPSDVGVLAPAGMNCPDEHIMLTLENERDNNWNEKEGWLGASTQDHSYTKLHFCRVDGRGFGRARGTSTSLNYAVLKLGDSCPPGAVDFERYFDNEDRPRGCPSWPWACGVGKPETIGDFAPSTYSANNLHLKLCLFRASPIGSSAPLPSVGIPYGVFAAASFSGAIASGWVHTDDEDDSNANHLTGDFVGSEVFLSGGHNTTLHLAEVNPMLTGVFALERDVGSRLAP